jgi:hypothetical protein
LIRAPVRAVNSVGGRTGEKRRGLEIRFVSPRAKYNWLTLLFVAPGLLLIALAAYISPWFILAFLLLAVGVGLAGRRVRCPRCKQPVGYVRAASGRFGLWIELAPRKCRSCGYDLTEDVADPRARGR